MDKKLRNPFAYYGYREQNYFDSYENNSSRHTREINELKKKDDEQDKRDDDFDNKLQENDKKDEEQDESIKQAIDKSLVSLEMQGTPSEGSCRTYVVKQGGNDIGKIEIPFSSLVKSTTYDEENNLLIFTIENDKEIKVDLTKLIGDSDLVQRKIFDDFKNEVSTTIANLSDNLNELSSNVDNKFYVVSKSVNDVNDKLEDFKDETSEKFTSIDKTIEDQSYVVSKALNELKDDLEDAIDESMVIKGMGENSLTLKDSGSIAKGKNSLALGTGVVASNDYEVSLGKYNDSANDTAFSFGIGSSENDRKNAIEIKNDGRIYIWSEGKYVCLNEIIGRVDVNETY